MPDSPPPAVMPTVLTWTSQLLDRMPSHTVMAALFLYFVLSVIPASETRHASALAAQRADFLATYTAFEERRNQDLKSVEDRCYAAIAADAAIAEENRRLNQRVLELVEELRGEHARHP